MKHIKPLYVSIFWVVLGAALVIGNFTGLIDDYWFSMGIAIIVVGSLQILRYIRYMTNSEYRETYDIQATDERNKFIANKAWAWAGYWFVMLSAIASIVFKLLNREDLTMFCAFSVCLIMVLYWLSWLCLKKKY